MGTYKTFKLSDEILKKVNRGDAVKLSKQSGMLPENFSRAFRIGRCTEDIYNAIKNYYQII